MNSLDSPGGKVYLHYDIDEANQMLYLQDKNVPPAGRSNDGGSNARGSRSTASATEKLRRSEPVRLAWHYSRPSDSRIILSGQDENKNSIYVVLDRVDQHLPILIDSPVPGQAQHYDPFFGKRYPVHDKSYDGFGAPRSKESDDDQ
jgi:hypothetical protein